MGLFHERFESKREIIIKHKYWALFYAVFAAWLVTLIFVRSPIGLFFYAFYVIFIIVFIADNWRPVQEARQAFKDGKATRSGSRFSFSNPPVIRIKKEGDE